MQIALNSKKTVLITSLGLCFIGSLFAAFKLYYRNKRKLLNKQKQKLKNGSSTGSKSSLKQSRPYSLNYDLNATTPNKISSTGSQRTERSILIASQYHDDIKNLPAEELLELGINYLNQAIKSWEIALDSIESAAYMQSQTLALPSEEHADLVFKLRSLLDKANDINSNCSSKLVKSSHTLQIIQSRLAYKQQLYTEALLKQNQDSLKKNSESSENVTGAINIDYSKNQSISTPLGSLSNRYGYLSDEDNESFVSADSDVDWLDDDLWSKMSTQNVVGTNALYEMAYSNASLGRVSYRVSRYQLLGCKSEIDFASKLHVIRLGFDRLLQETEKKQWLIDEGRRLVTTLLQKAEKDCSGFNKAYDEMIKFTTDNGNWKLIKDELSTRDVNCLNFYDIVLDFILLDAFDDLENPPTAITTVIQNRWLSQSFKETALSTAVWSVLKAKRKLLKYPNGFISRFYSINEYLVPVLAWGFLGTDEQLNISCSNIKNCIVKYLTSLFDLEQTRYTNLDELHSDLENHTKNYLREIFETI